MLRPRWIVAGALAVGASFGALGIAHALSCEVNVLTSDLQLTSMTDEGAPVATTSVRQAEIVVYESGAMRITWTLMDGSTHRADLRPVGGEP